MSNRDHSNRNSKHTLITLGSLPWDVMYFVMGVSTLGYGTLALVRWAIESWQLGAKLPGIAVAAAAIICPVGFLFFFRRRPIAAVAIAVFWLGGVAFALAERGFSLPASWFS